MCFILFCLVMRTAFQAKQFEFIQKVMRRADIETIDDLIKNNFTIYIPLEVMATIVDMEFAKK